jgi:hypothetical protein
VGSAREVISPTLALPTDDGAFHIDSSGVTITDGRQLPDHANID